MKSAETSETSDRPRNQIMLYRYLELILHHGRNIGQGSSEGRPEAYAEVSLRGNPGKAYKSNVDTAGGTNPKWNLHLTFEIQDSSVREPGAEDVEDVVVKLYHKRVQGDVSVGEAEIPIHALYDRGIWGSAALNVVPTGRLMITYRLRQSTSTLNPSPVLLRQPSVDSLLAQKSRDKGSQDFPSDHYLCPRGPRGVSLKTSPQDPRAEGKDEDEFHLGTSSWKDPSAEREDHFGISSWKDPRTEGKDEDEFRLGTSSWKDPSVEREDHFGISSWKDPRTEEKGKRIMEMGELFRSGTSFENEGASGFRFGRKDEEETWKMIDEVFRSGTSFENEGAFGFHFGTRDVGKIKEMNDVAKSDRYKRFKDDFILFCSVFPLDYEFTKDVLVWQWIAIRLTEFGEDEEMDTECFYTLVDENYIIPSGYDYVLDQTKYKIGDKTTTDGRYLDSKQSHHALPKVELLSLTFKEIGVLKQYSCLHTLVIHDCYEVDHLPSDLFSELKSLKILNMSHTNIVELPSSVKNLMELRFLDMSNTPLVWLRESICSLTHLQTLKLDGCLQLKGLPEGTSKLINLRHLILDVVRQLGSMPVGLGKLSNLRTLTAFLVGKEEGCSVAELKDMNKLRGTIRLLNLENVKTKEEASEACLCKKVDIKKIEFQWSDIEDDEIPGEEEILESLKPHVDIQELKILFYSGAVLPSWICDPSFKELVTIVLYKCRYYICLPSLGKLPSLKHLSIIENNVVMVIGSSFCREKINQHHVAFPKLEKLTFESMSRLEMWTGLANGDFPSIRHLIIEYCPEFVVLPYFLLLDSLSHLEIRYCSKLSLTAEEKLPSSLQSLMIKESPELKKWCSHDRIAHVPTVYFDNQKINWRM